MRVTRLRSGLAAGVAAYLIWGLFPLYFPLLDSAAPVEILAHRIVWSLAFLLLVLAAMRAYGFVRELDRRRSGCSRLRPSWSRSTGACSSTR